MEYKIIQERDKDILTREVNESLQNGWELYGNLNVIFLGQSLGFTPIQYAQAMTYTEKKTTGETNESN